MMHQPVLLNEVLQFLDSKKGEFLIDGTVDGGGHATEMLSRVMPMGALLGVDWDTRMIEARIASRRYGARERYVHGNYADLPETLKKEKLGRADGLLLDLGFSSEQLTGSGRGFSFGAESAKEPLLMTYDDSCTPVAQILREMDERELARIIFELGGERLSRRIAKAIKTREARAPILTCGELAETIRAATPGHYERGRIDPATRTFQALRIYANDELGNLEKVLRGLPRILRSGGRVVIMSFHSLEDRIVKQQFQHMAKEGTLDILTKKPVTAREEEIARNPRSRSAKLRAAIMR